MRTVLICLSVALSITARARAQEPRAQEPRAQEPTTTEPPADVPAAAAPPVDAASSDALPTTTIVDTPPAPHRSEETVGALFGDVVDGDSAAPAAGVTVTATLETQPPVAASVTTDPVSLRWG